MTSSEIGLLLGVSDRTVRSYIKELNEVLKKYNASIESKASFGYKLIAIDIDNIIIELQKVYLFNIEDKIGFIG